MKKFERINDSKFSNFESSKISNLAKVIGGAMLTERPVGQNCLTDYEYQQKTVPGGSDTYWTTTCDGDTASAASDKAKKF